MADAPMQAAYTHVAQNTAEERVKASRFVLRKARSRADLRDLLNTIGLNNPPRQEAL